MELFLIKIEYKIIKETGPDHDKSFEAEVEVNGNILATGIGKSKKEAQMQAAKKALEIGIFGTDLKKIYKDWLKIAK